MNIARTQSQELQSAIVAYVNLLDGLAAFGVVMIKIQNPSIAGRNEWIAKHLNATVDAADHLSMIVNKSESVELTKLSETLVQSTVRLLDSFSRAAADSAASDLTGTSYHAAINSWDDAFDAVSAIVSALGYSMESWWRAMEERHPEYRRLVQHLLIV